MLLVLSVLRLANLKGSADCFQVLLRSGVDTKSRIEKMFLRPLATSASDVLTGRLYDVLQARGKFPKSH